MFPFSKWRMSKLPGVILQKKTRYTADKLSPFKSVNKYFNLKSKLQFFSQQDSAVKEKKTEM